MTPLTLKVDSALLFFPFSTTVAGIELDERSFSDCDERPEQSLEEDLQCTPGGDPSRVRVESWQADRQMSRIMTYHNVLLLDLEHLAWRRLPGNLQQTNM